MEDENILEETSTEDSVTSEESQNTDESVEDTETETTVEGEESEEATDSEDEDPYQAELNKLKDRFGKKLDKQREKFEGKLKSAITREEAEQIAQQAAEKAASKAEIRTLIAQRSRGNESLRQLVLHHLEHSIILTGNPDEDVENAFALATKNKAAGLISETKKAVESKKTRLAGSGAGAPLQQSKPVQKYSRDILDGAAFAGVSPEEFVKRNK